MRSLRFFGQNQEMLASGMKGSSHRKVLQWGNPFWLGEIANKLSATVIAEARLFTFSLLSSFWT